ncbi:MAG: sigma-70 family RNA polymerase sigma factor [Roseivirga sp.]|nr:sigma-70 family RNA polymerase sigma factor [Roseivirga sp.]
MTDISDLIEQCIKGDAKSQKELYDLLKGRLMGVCLRYNTNKEEANDVFQEAMIRIFNSIHRAGEVDNVMAWANRITCNVAIDFYKKKRARMMVSMDESETAEFTSDEVDVIGQMSAEEILKILHELPPNYRLVFNLYVIEGYSHKEIADQLEIAESTSRVLLTRAKRRMIELLKKTEVVKHVYG